MKANELRIGNWIECSEVDEFGNLVYKAYQVSVSDIWNIRYDQIRKKEYEPIPLTEEWLLRFGFRNMVPSKGGFSFDLNKLMIHLPSIEYPSGRTYYNSWCIMGKYPESVHQLQNLYFALTGQELELR